MRNSTLLMLFLLLTMLLISLSLVDAFYRQGQVSASLKHRATLVNQLGLSDLALFTEARYTRNLALSDRHSAFQDHPTSFDHFPSASLVLPPPHLTP